MTVGDDLKPHCASCGQELFREPWSPWAWLRNFRERRRRRAAQRRAIWLDAHKDSTTQGGNPREVSK